MGWQYYGPLWGPAASGGAEGPPGSENWYWVIYYIPPDSVDFEPLFVPYEHVTSDPQVIP